MGKRPGIDDSGDPLLASLIQHRVRDNRRSHRCFHRSPRFHTGALCCLPLVRVGGAGSRAWDSLWRRAAAATPARLLHLSAVATPVARRAPPPRHLRAHQSRHQPPSVRKLLLLRAHWPSSFPLSATMTSPPPPSAYIHPVLFLGHGGGPSWFLTAPSPTHFLAGMDAASPVRARMVALLDSLYPPGGPPVRPRFSNTWPTSSQPSRADQHGNPGLSRAECWPSEDETALARQRTAGQRQA